MGLRSDIDVQATHADTGKTHLLLDGVDFLQFGALEMDFDGSENFSEALLYWDGLDWWVLISELTDQSLQMARLEYLESMPWFLFTTVYIIIMRYLLILRTGQSIFYNRYSTTSVLQ